MTRDYAEERFPTQRMFFPIKILQIFLHRSLASTIVGMTLPEQPLTVAHAAQRGVGAALAARPKWTGSR
jgi:hypothetical protein